MIDISGSTKPKALFIDLLFFFLPYCPMTVGFKFYFVFFGSAPKKEIQEIKDYSCNQDSIQEEVLYTWLVRKR